MSGRNPKARGTTQQQRPGPQVLPPAAGTRSPPRGSASPGTDTQADKTEALKLELLECLRQDIAESFKTELGAALGGDLSTIRADLQVVKTQLANDKAASDAKLALLEGTVGETELWLSACTDDVVELKCKYERLITEFSTLENKCEDLESRSRRNNIRIIGVPEDTVVNTTAKGDKEPLLDRAHRSAQPSPRPDERPRSHYRQVPLLHRLCRCFEARKRGSDGPPRGM